MHLGDLEETRLLSYTVTVSVGGIGQCLLGITVSLYNTCPKTIDIKQALSHYLSYFKNPQCREGGRKGKRE